MAKFQQEKIFGLPNSMYRGTSNKNSQPAQPLETDDGYFESYGHFGIHEEMLKDSIRTESYRNAILLNKDQFHNKIVLDIGSGTGVLSMFAAQAGAKHVYAVEMARIADFSIKIIKENGFENQISVLKGKLEEITLPVSKVDIIISEWMGYFLLFESMLDSVLFARDKWLAKDGIILPDKTTLYICGIEDFDYKQEKIHFWNKVYGFDMSCLKDESLKEPLVDFVENTAVVTDSYPLISIDLYTVTPRELTFERLFKLKAIKSNYLHAFVCYFDVFFNSVKSRIWFSTSPSHPKTHWKQTVMYTDEDLMLTKGNYISGKLKLRRNAKNHREIDIFLRTTYSESPIEKGESAGNKLKKEEKERAGIQSKEEGSDARDLSEKKGKTISQKRWYYLR